MKNHFIFIVTLFTLILFATKSAANGDCDPKACKTLVYYSKQTNLDSKQFNNACAIIARLRKVYCSDCKIIDKNEVSSYVGITFLFGKICTNYNDSAGAKAYIEYLLSNEDSAEEELSFLADDLFFKRPQWMLQEIAKLPKKQQDEILVHLAWGYENNYSNTLNKYHLIDNSLKPYTKPTKEECNLYNKLFLNRNKELEQLYSKYKALIDRMLLH